MPFNTVSILLSSLLLCKPLGKKPRPNSVMHHLLGIQIHTVKYSWRNITQNSCWLHLKLMITDFPYIIHSKMEPSFISIF